MLCPKSQKRLRKNGRQAQRWRCPWWKTPFSYKTLRGLEKEFPFWAWCLDLTKNTLNLVGKSEMLIGRNNSPGNFALRDRDFRFTKTPPEHSGSGNQATTSPKSRYIFENPNYEHTRARQDPQSTIFNIFFGKSDARRSRKPLGPVLTRKKLWKNQNSTKHRKVKKSKCSNPEKETRMCKAL